VVTYSGIFLSVTQQPKSERDCLVVEVRRSHMIRHTHTQSVGLLLKSDPSDAETSTLQYITLTRDRHPSPRWDSNSQFQKRVASELCLRQHGRRDGQTHTHTHTHTHMYKYFIHTFPFWGEGGVGNIICPEMDCRMHRFAFCKGRVFA
jgi:hypothetical protein